MKKFFPEAYDKFISYVPLTFKNNVLEWFHKQLSVNDRSVNLKAASVWAEYENSCSSLDYVVRPISGENALAISKIEAHFFQFNKDLYDQEIKVSFIDRLRDEIKFDSLEALRSQLKKDQSKALKILATYKSQK